MPSNERHLLIAYTWSVNNIGDIGITPGLMQLARTVRPEIPLRVITSQWPGHEAYPYLEEYLEGHFPGSRVLPNPFWLRLGAPRFDDAETAWGRFCRRWGEHKLDAFLKGCLASDLCAAVAHDLLNRFPAELWAQLQAEADPAVEAYENAGFVVYNSGTTFNFGRLQVRDFWTYALHFALPLILARHLGIPYGVNAQSFDAADWPVDLVFRPLFKEARFVFTRDGDSGQYLRQRDLHNATDGFRPDSTFFYRIEDEAWAESFLERHGLEDRRFLVLVTRHADPVRSTKTEWQKAHADPTAGSVSQERQEAQMATLRAFVEGWIERTGIPVLMAAEVRSAMEPMKAWLGRDLSPDARKKVVWLEDFWSTEQAYSVYRRARIAVSMEMHTNIMALQALTPTVHIPFREAGRKARMIRDLGFPDWLLDIDETSADALLDTCLAIDASFDGSVERIRNAMARVDALGRDVAERIFAQWRTD